MSDIIKIDFADLVSDKHSTKVQSLVEKAFSLKGFGAVVITNIPNFANVRAKVLNNMYRLSQEPQEVLDRLVQPNVDSAYEVGWHTRKMNAAFGKSSNKYVSYFSRYPKETVVFPQDPNFEKENYNIWPTTIQNFKEDLWNMNKLLVLPLLGLLKYIDSYLALHIKGYKNKFVNSFFSEYCNANRLVVYSPLDQFSFDKESMYNWDNWHTDFGIFATSVHPMYFSKSGENVKFGSTCLFIKDRMGVEHEMVFAEDEFAITTSDSMFIESAGYCPATPHTVKVKEGMPTDVYRVQAVSFYEPNLNYIMDIPTGESFYQIIERDPKKFDHRGVDDFKSGCLYKDLIDELLQFLYK